MNFKNTKYNTFPFFVHCPIDGDGNDKEIIQWNKIKKFFLIKSLKNEKQKELDDISVLTWSNSGKISLLEKSLYYFKTHYCVVGQDVKNWTNDIKIDLTYDFLKKCKTKYVIGIDAFDAALVRDLLKINLNFKNKIIFNHTPATFPIELSKHYGSNWKFYHLNAGCWVGETKFLIEFYKLLTFIKKNIIKLKFIPTSLLNKNNLKSEQFYIKIASNFFSENVEIDKSCNFFQVLHSESFNNNFLEDYSKFFS